MKGATKDANSDTWRPWRPSAQLASFEGRHPLKDATKDATLAPFKLLLTYQ